MVKDCPYELSRPPALPSAGVTPPGKGLRKTPTGVMPSTELKKLVDHLMRSEHPPTMMAALASMEVDLEDYYKEALEHGATSEYARYNRLDEQRRRLSAAIGKQKRAKPHAWEESRAQVPVAITVVMMEVIHLLPAGELTSNDIIGECKVMLEQVLPTFGWTIGPSEPTSNHDDNVMAYLEDRTSVGSSSRVTFSFEIQAEENDIAIKIKQHPVDGSRTPSSDLVFSASTLARLIYECQAEGLGLEPDNLEAVV